MKSKITKLHIGCGTVYLKGYINCDVWNPPGTLQAELYPEEVVRNLTTFDKYYEKADYFNKRSSNKFVVADWWMNGPSFFCDGKGNPLTVADKSVDVIVAVQMLEHVSPDLRMSLLQKLFDMLRTDGFLFVTVPDLLGNCKKFLESESYVDRQMASRLIYGSGRNILSLHREGFWREKLEGMLLEVGFKSFEDMGNWQHFYPVVALRAFKE